MSKSNRSKKALDVSECCYRMNLAGKEVRAIGELIRFFDSNVTMDEDVLTGLGEILDRVGKRISAMATRLDEDYCEKTGASPS